MYSFNCRDDSKNKSKSISKSQTKPIKFGEKKCLDGRDYQRECNKYLLRLLKHERYLQKAKNLTLSIFDDKKCYENDIKSKAWE